MTDVKESGNVMGKVMLPATSSSMTSLAWVNDGTGRNILGESHRPLHALYCYIPKNGTFLVILQTNVRP